LKVLYVWNVSGAFSPVAKWLNENGHKAIICTRRVYDPFGHSAIPHADIVNGNQASFYVRIARHILSFRPDIIHVSSSTKLLLLCCALAPKTILIMSYHGSDIRKHPERAKYDRVADLVHVTTPDLQEYGQWLDRPIDPMFTYTGGRIDNTALMYYAPHFIDMREQARQWCKERGVILYIFNGGIRHDKMPAFLSSFEFYMDYKGLQALSKLALEALSCGCKVVQHDGQIYLPKDQQITRPEDYLAMYQRLLGDGEE
jgi:hypothetical protein